jgi:hypothetical protein
MMNERNEATTTMTRRSLLARAGLGLAGMTLGEAAQADEGFRQDDKTPKPTVLVGSGEQTYECTHDWLMPPSNILYGDTHGVAQDSRGRIYIAHTVHPNSPSGDAVCVFDDKGKFLTSWGSQFRGGAHGIDLRREGREEFIYHCDTKNRNVVKTKLDGTVVWEKGVPVESGVYKDGARYVPTNIAFSPNGDFFIADGYGSNWIHQYNVKGEYIRTFGGTGTDDGKFKTPHGIWLDNRSPFSRKEPLLVVTDRENHRLQYFSLDGKYVGKVDGLRRPCNFDMRDGVALVPDLVSVVTLLDRDNKIMAQLGDGDPSNLRGAPREQFVPGKFVHPHGARFLRDGSIIVVEWVPIGRVTRLKKVRR